MDELELKDRAGKFVFQLYSNNRKTLIELFEAAFTRMADYKARAERAEAERDELRAQRDAALRKEEGIFDSAAETELRLNATIDALRAELAAARATGGWRPVTEPPTENGDYLVWIKYPKEPGFHSVARWTQRFKWENNFVHPTYWRPLPAAPDDGQEARP